MFVLGFLQLFRKRVPTKTCFDTVRLLNYFSWLPGWILYMENSNLDSLVFLFKITCIYSFCWGWCSCRGMSVEVRGQLAGAGFSIFNVLVLRDKTRVLTSMADTTGCRGFSLAPERTSSCASSWHSNAVVLELCVVQWPFHRGHLRPSENKF